MNECNLGNLPFPEQCCCICEHHYEDCSHPHTDGGSILSCRGYVCVLPNFLDSERRQAMHSGWPEHSIGCEMFRKRAAKVGVVAPSMWGDNGVNT